MLNKKRLEVSLKEGVNVTLENSSVKVEGPKGSLTFVLPEGVLLKKEEGRMVFSGQNGITPLNKPMIGLARAILLNNIQGVSEGFEKKLELQGVGYRAQAGGSELTLSLGFSHPVKIQAPEGVSFSVAENIITVSGINKILVGNTAAQVRAVKPPEPYKGKGIRYVGERVRRKAGKAAKAVGGK